MSATCHPTPQPPINEVGWIVVDLASAMEPPFAPDDQLFAHSMREAQIWLRGIQVAPGLAGGFLPDTAWSVVQAGRPFAPRRSHLGQLCSRHGLAHKAEAGAVLVHGQRFLAEQYIALWRSVVPMPLDLLQLQGLAIKARVSLDSELVAQRCAASKNRHTRSVMQWTAITQGEPDGETTWEFELNSMKAVRLIYELHELGEDGGAYPQWEFDVVALGQDPQQPLDFTDEIGAGSAPVPHRGETLHFSTRSPRELRHHL